MTYHVPISTIPLLQDPPFVLFLILLGTAIGCRVLQRLGAPLHGVTRLERGVLAAGIGLGLLQYLAFGLGSVALLTPLAVRCGLILLTPLFARDILRVLRGVGRAWRERQTPERWLVVGLALLTVFLAVALLQCLCPCTDADGMGYHLRAPKQWLQWGNLGYLPTLTHTNSPMGVEMLSTLALATWSDTAAKLIHYAFGLLALMGIYALGRRLQNPTVGFAALALTLFPGFTQPLNLFTNAYIDLGLMCEIVCATLAWVLWRQTGARGWLWTTALCVGLAASFKLTGLMLVVALGVVILLEERHRGRSPVALAQTALPWLTLALLPVLPWLARSWVLTGNPVAPLLPHLFHTRDWSTVQSEDFAAYMRYYNWGSTRPQWGLSQRRMIVWASVFLTALAGGLLFRWWRNGIARPLLLLTTLVTALNLLATGPYLRFFVPLFPLYFLLLALAIAQWPAALPWIRFAAMLLICGNGLRYLRSSTPRVGEAFQVATGRVTRQTYLERTLPLMPLWDYANQHLKPETHLAVVGTGDAYYCDAYCYIIKAYYQDRLRLDSWEEFRSDLQHDRIEYLVLPLDPHPAPPYGPNTPSARNEGPFTQRAAREYGHLIFRAADYGLFRLDLQRLSGATATVPETIPNRNRP